MAVTNNIFLLDDWGRFAQRISGIQHPGPAILWDNDIPYGYPCDFDSKKETAKDYNLRNLKEEKK